MLTMTPVVLEALSPAWHAWRAGGIGGSDAPIIAADAGLIKPASWMCSLEEVWKIKTGRISGVKPDNWATRKGRYAEPLARKAFETETGILLSPIYGEMDGNPFIRSSFDGIDFDGEVIGEIKLGSANVHASVKDLGEVPEYYQPQIVHQALTAWGMPETWGKECKIAFISYNIEAEEMKFIMRDALDYRQFAEDVFIANQSFWNKVVANIEPCSDEWRDAAFGYLTLSAQIAELEEEADTYKAKLAELLGNRKKVAAAGVTVYRQERKGNIDYGKLIAENTNLTEDDIEKYRKKGSESVVVKSSSNK